MRLAAPLALALLAGCLGLGPDESLPHELHVQSYEPHPVEARIVVQQGGVELHNATYAFAAQDAEARTAAFGPAEPEGYDVVVTFTNGTGPSRHTVTMGRGGWGLYVSFHEGRVGVSTLHGD